MSIGSSYARLRDYYAAADPFVGAANLVAIVLAGNQPLYPVYLFVLFGFKAWPALISAVIGLAFYGAVPWVTRRAPLFGRAFMCAGAVAHILFTTWLLGEATGISLLLAAAVMLSALVFRRRERWVMLPLVGLAIAGFLATTGRFGPPLLQLSDAEAHELLVLNAASMALLLGFLGIVFSNVMATLERGAAPVED
jgi:hypothetical protein